MEKAEPDFTKGVLAGVIGGVLAGLMMEQFQALWTKMEKAMSKGERGFQGEKESPTTLRAANAISKGVVGHKVARRNEAAAGEAVHYGMAAASGAIYGGLAEVLPFATVANGVPFGVGVWFLADEVSLPALGLSKRPDKVPLPTHFYALASHFVYGWITETVRSAVRRAL